MSVYNGEKYLEPAIRSILAQSYTDYEFFIVDDGSSDKTLLIVTRYAALNPQIRIFRNEISIGLPSCLNMMAEHARGKYLARMDADDIAHEKRFERQVELMDYSPDIDVCFANINFMNDEGRIICARNIPSSTKAILKLLPYLNYFPHPTAMLRTSSFRKIGGYNQLFFKGQDWELWQRMNSYGMRLEIIQEPLLDYRLHVQGSSFKLSGSANKSQAFFEAVILIRNGCRFRALTLLRKLSFLECCQFFVLFFMPRIIFLFLVKFRAKYSKSSPQQKLLGQCNIKK